MSSGNRRGPNISRRLRAPRRRHVPEATPTGGPSSALRSPCSSHRPRTCRKDRPDARCARQPSVACPDAAYRKPSPAGTQDDRARSRRPRHHRPAPHVRRSRKTTASAAVLPTPCTAMRAPATKEPRASAKGPTWHRPPHRHDHRGGNAARAMAAPSGGGHFDHASSVRAASLGGGGRKSP